MELVNAKTGEVLDFKNKLIYCQSCLETLKVIDEVNGIFEPCNCGKGYVGILFSHGERVQ